MRSNLCNRYLCGGLTQLTRALDTMDAAYIASAGPAHLHRVALVSAAGVRAVPVSETDGSRPTREPDRAHDARTR
jgi:hypothetical protein